MKFKLIAVSAMMLVSTALHTTVSDSGQAQAEETGNQKVLTWSGCGITRKAFVAELAAAYEKKTGIKIKTSGGGATAGIRNAANGSKDLGGSCRYKLDNVEEERMAKMEPVAWDALVVIVHPDNPVSNISIDKLKKVFLGEIDNWKELGGDDQPIKLYARKSKISGVGSAFRDKAFKNKDIDFTGADVFVKSSGPLEKAIQKEVTAMGVTGISSAKKRKVKILSVDGVEPTYNNIKDGEYRMYRPLYLIVNANNTNPDVTDFIKFAHSEEGREVIRKNGTVPYLDALGLMMKQLQESSL